ncbi:MAG: nucleotide exchange factor GrpE [Synergistaceae bacterium]|jgi:molecular chaperone GrpE|nr:nucleotide exchange factor GrpE [Synergistaceae bacterium]
MAEEWTANNREACENREEVNALENEKNREGQEVDCEAVDCEAKDPEGSCDRPKSEDEADDEAIDAEPEGEQDEIESLKTQLAAARADLYNYRQRTERDRAKTRKLISEDKVAEFLPVLDNLDRALSVPEDGTAKDVLVGVRMVQRQFLSVLENSGVTVIPTEGCAFDPLQHEAIETEFVEDPDRNGMVLCELLRGYRTADRVLRPAQVRVGKLGE